MAIQKARPTTFRETLASVSDRNAVALMSRARIANRVAKTAERYGRRNAYDAKTRALVALVRGFPDRFAVTVDPMLPSFVVVRAPDLRFGLHAPASRFPSGAENERGRGVARSYGIGGG